MLLSDHGRQFLSGGGAPPILGRPPPMARSPPPLPCPPVPAELEVGKERELAVKTKGAGGQGKVGAKVTGPSRKGVPCAVEPGGPDCSLLRFVPREEGPHQLDVTYDGVPVPGSPFPVEVVPPTDPSKVGPRVSGTGGWVWGACWCWGVGIMMGEGLWGGCGAWEGPNEGDGGPRVGGIPVRACYWF